MKIFSVELLNELKKTGFSFIPGKRIVYHLFLEN